MSWTSAAWAVDAVTAQAIAARQSAEVTDQLIVRYRTTPPAAGDVGVMAAGAARRSGVGLRHKRDMFHGGRVLQMDRELSVAQISALATDMMAADPTIELVEPDVRMMPTLVPNDPLMPGSQWHYYEALGGINLPAAWDRSTGVGVRVAVLDTGYRPHADLAANIVGGHDLVTNVVTANDGNGRDSSPLDPGDWCAPYNSSWHGTHVAGTIAAVSGNGSGVAGVAFGAKVVPVRVLGKCGGSLSDAADGIVWASGGALPGVPVNAYPARVLNLSLGGVAPCTLALAVPPSPATTMQVAINAANARGAVVVVSAGNSNLNASTFTPANCNGVITVGAVTRTGAKWTYPTFGSNYGAVVDVSAPGEGVYSTLNAGTTGPGVDGYASYSGTSMAAPHVAGVAALMLAKNPALTPAQVEAMVKSSARPFPAGFAGGGGTGIVDAKKAVDTAMASLPTTVAEVEPNNTFAAPQVIAAAHAVVNGTVTLATDTDYYRVSIASGKTLSATLNMKASTQNYQLYLYNPAGVLVASSVNGAGLPETVRVTNATAAAQLYRVRVVYSAGGLGASGQYVLNLLQQ